VPKYGHFTLHGHVLWTCSYVFNISVKKVMLTDISASRSRLLLNSGAGVGATLADAYPQHGSGPTFWPLESRAVRHGKEWSEECLGGLVLEVTSVKKKQKKTTHMGERCITSLPGIYWISWVAYTFGQYGLGKVEYWKQVLKSWMRQHHEIWFA
jgi:hypothetical protein